MNSSRSSSPAATSSSSPPFPAFGCCLRGEKVFLRRLETRDIDFLYTWENDPEVWQYGDCGAEALSEGERFSREVLREFIENQQYDISRTGQIRFVICRVENRSDHGISHFPEASSSSKFSPDKTPVFIDDPVGFIDIFDYDPLKLSAGTGILICKKSDRGCGYGSEALDLVCEYAVNFLKICELWCTVRADNFSSARLFRGKDFAIINAEQKAAGESGVGCEEVLLRKIFKSRMFQS